MLVLIRKHLFVLKLLNLQMIRRNVFGKCTALCFTNYRLHMAATGNRFRTLINPSHTKLAINKNCSHEIPLHYFLQNTVLIPT